MNLSNSEWFWLILILALLIYGLIGNILNRKPNLIKQQAKLYKRKTQYELAKQGKDPSIVNNAKSPKELTKEQKLQDAVDELKNNDNHKEDGNQ